MQLWLECPAAQCKPAKTLLEQHGLLDRRLAVERSPRCFAHRMLPTTQEVATPQPPCSVEAYLQDNASTDLCHVLRQLSPDTTLHWLPATGNAHLAKKPAYSSPVAQTIAKLASRVPPELLASLPKFDTFADFTLFQLDAFSGAAWQAFLGQHPDFFDALAAKLHTTRLATKVAIPRADVMRRPQVEPLRGDFEGFWTQDTVTVDAHRIAYAWSPLHTMYSHGNLSEKLRTARMKQVKDKVVVDLYAGIGYWVFPYLYAGASRVYACEINPYSVEGFLRGAKLNRHEVQLLKPDDSGVWPNVQADASQIVLMPLPNEECVPVFRSKADIVNMGLLPDCLAGLPIAVAALKDDGGVIRVHGEARVATGAKEASRCAWANAMAERLVELAGTRWAGITMVNVRVQAITHVKTLGKELAHLVADIELRS